MKTIKTVTTFGIVLLMAAAIRPVQAENNDSAQLRTQDHVRTQLNLQTPASDFGQVVNSEQKMVINKNQNQNRNQYRNMNNTSVERSGSGEATGSDRSESKNRYNSTNRSSQDKTKSGSMSRQSTTTRSMGGGRR